MRHRLYIVGLLFSVAACAGSPNFAPTVQDSDTQFIKTNTRDGSQFVLSAGQHSRVALWQVHEKAYAQFDPTFDIKVAATDAFIPNFDISSISVTQNGKALRVWGQKDITDKLESDKREIETMNMLIGIMGAMSTQVAAAKPTRINVATAATANVGAAVSSMSTAQFVADSTAVEQIVDTTHLSEASIPPGSTLGALISVPDLNSDAVEFTITAGPDVHHIVLTPKKR